VLCLVHAGRSKPKPKDRSLRESRHGQLLTVVSHSSVNSSNSNHDTRMPFIFALLQGHEVPSSS
jgi:hypothetical protein